MTVKCLQIFEIKNTPKKSNIQMFDPNINRFCYQSKEKVLSLNTFGRMQI